MGAPRSAGARSGPPPATLVAPQAGLLTLLSSCLPPFLAASSCSFSPRPTGKQPHCSLPSCLSSKQPSLAFCNVLILSLLMRRKSIHKRSKGGSKSCPWCPGPVLPLPWQSLAVPMESSLPPPQTPHCTGPFSPSPTWAQRTRRARGKVGGGSTGGKVSFQAWAGVGSPGDSHTISEDSPVIQEQLQGSLAAPLSWRRRNRVGASRVRGAVTHLLHGGPSWPR